MKNKYVRYVILVFLVTIIFYSAYIIYIFNKDIEQKSNWIQKVYNIKLTNQNINALLSKKTHYFNYDQINQSISRIEKTLSKMKKDPAIQSFLEQTIYLETYKQVLNKFEMKKRLISKFSSTNSILNNSLRYISTLLEDLNKQNYLAMEKLILLHSLLMQMSINIEVDAKQINKKLLNFQEAIKNSENKNALLYVNHARVILQKYEYLNSIGVIIEKNSFDNHLDILITRLEEYINRVTKNIQHTIEGLIVFIFFLLIGIIYTLNKKILQGAELRMFKKAVQTSDNFILITDTNHLIEYANDSFLKSTGYEKNEILGKTPAILQSGLHDAKFYEKLNQKISRGEKWSGEFINKDADEKIRYEKATITPITNEDGEITHFLAIKLDITEDKKHQHEIEKKNIEIQKRYYWDYLTGLGNRNLLMKLLREDQEGRLYYINIDNFSHIKTFYGLDSSDTIIKLVADVLKTIKEDKKEYNPSLFRITFDEFCLWCPYSHIEPEQIMETIRKRLVDRIYFVHTTPLKISITLGASSDIKTNKNRYLEAEIAHHNARREGVHYKVYTATNGIEQEYKNNIIISHVIQEALEKNDVLIYFQPIFDIKKDKIASYEVLVRLKKDDGEILLPQEFLNIAQKSNFYHLIMMEVIKKTFAYFEENPTYKFSINISSLDIMHKGTMDFLISKLAHIKYPQNFSIEILESENIENYELFKEMIARIKKFGCMVGIDDFGAGHSNYYRLSKLDFDYLKIDGSIIKKIHKDSYSQVTVQTIMTFANKMNFPVVAEHVHCKEVLEKVNEYGISYVQGFYLAKPKPNPIL